MRKNPKDVKRVSKRAGGHKQHSTIKDIDQTEMNLHMQVCTWDQRPMLLFYSLHLRGLESWQQHPHPFPSFQYKPNKDYHCSETLCINK